MWWKINTKEALSVPAVATYAGTGISGWAIWDKQSVVITTALSVWVFILIVSYLALYKRYKKFKPFKSIDSDLCKLTHRMSEYAYDLRISRNQEEIRSLTKEALRDTIDTISSVFSSITNENCTVSIMLRVKSGNYTTTIYSHNAEIGRKKQASSEISSTEGVVGEAFRTHDVVTWTYGHRSFKEIRSEYGDYYRSGISAPFKVSGSNAGILNIDSKLENVFAQKDHKMIAAFFSNCISIIIESQQFTETALQ